MSSASWCIVWGYGNSGQLYSYDAFFSYPAIVYFTAGVAGVFSALHRMWKPWCKQKKVWFHGLMQRAPRFVGCPRENENNAMHCAIKKFVG